jgi:hypothetical protein
MTGSVWVSSYKLAVRPQMRFVNTFEKHRSETGKSLDAYLKERT